MTSSRFQVVSTPLADLYVFVRQPICDERGFFERVFCQTDFDPFLGEERPMQINRSMTRHVGSVRGLHYQRAPHAEIKLISCLRGEVFDVAVDLRRDSPTFLRWHAELLSAANGKTFVLPRGFAHGFQTLTDNAELLYIHSAPYVPESEGGVHPQDPRVSINWPQPIKQLSSRDDALPLLGPDFIGLVS